MILNSPFSKFLNSRLAHGRFLFRWVGFVIFGILGVSSSSRVAALSSSLSDLNFSQIGPSAGVRVGNQGVTFSPESNLWIDLQGGEQEIIASVAPVPSAKEGVVRCRFSCANSDVVTFIDSHSSPQQIRLSLKGENLLVIESLPVRDSAGIDFCITTSVITTHSSPPTVREPKAGLLWQNADWDVAIDGRSGGIVKIQHPADRLHMQWIRSATSWGTGWISYDGKRHVWDRPTEMNIQGATAEESIYDAGGVKVRVERRLLSDRRIREKYLFENITDRPITLGQEGIGIRLPLVDSYPNSELCMVERCHVHLWTGGRTSYVCALRMGGAAPHLGLVLTEGSLVNYSIDDRMQQSNDRGQFIVHPPAMTLYPGQKYEVSWLLFWHRGWNDFFAQAETIPGFVHFSGDTFATVQGHPINVTATGDFRGARIDVDGVPQPENFSEYALQLNLPSVRTGEHTVEISTDVGSTWMRTYVAPEPWGLIATRVRFIIDHQQVHQPGQPLDGAYLIYDNQSHRQVYESDFPDHDAGRERLAMGTLLALYAAHCQDPALKKDLERSLAAYAEFVKRELQAESGYVYNDVGRSGSLRLYNFPWAAQFYLAMNTAYPKAEYLRRALDTCRSFYNHGGNGFYCIGMPARWMINSLRAAGWENERIEMVAAFRRHADTFLRNGVDFPKQEVNYEQSIVAPAAQMMLEMYSVTGDARFLEGAREQLKVLELFGGQQPDYHLHDIAIRHWDDYWFGKEQLYGDTFPQYWSTITGSVFNLYAEATGDLKYRVRGENILAANLCVFNSRGNASCAFVYPLTINGKPSRGFDPWSNDQDWALVNWILFSNFARSSTSPHADLACF